MFLQPAFLSHCPNLLWQAQGANLVQGWAPLERDQAVESSDLIGENIGKLCTSHLNPV